MRPAMAGRPRGAPALLLSTSKAAPAALLPVLGSQVPGGRGAAGAQHRATKQGLELYGLHGKKAVGTGAARPGEEVAPGELPRVQSRAQGCPAPGAEALDTNWTPGGFFLGGGKKLPQSRRLRVFAGLQEHPATTASTIALCFN